MPRHRLPPTVLVLLLLGIAACGSGSHETTVPAGPDVAKDDVAPILRLVEQWRQGNEVRSFEALGALYAQDDHVTLVRQGKMARTWPQVSTAIRERLEGATEIHVRLADVQVDLLGDAAVVTAAMTREQADGATTVTETGILMLTVTPADDRWLIVAENFSFAPR